MPDELFLLTWAELVPMLSSPVKKERTTARYVLAAGLELAGHMEHDQTVKSMGCRQHMRGNAFPMAYAVVAENGVAEACTPLCPNCAKAGNAALLRTREHMAEAFPHKTFTVRLPQ